MSGKKECVAMLLAGGQGSRLNALTQKTAKPAVRFGGKYRIIDFTLTNCVKSGIDTVGVLTQYEPLDLNEHIGSGLPWDLNRKCGGLKILPPYRRQDGADWYRGTANAIYQNMDFIDRYNPEYVLILSGDHIYKMDYRRMLEYHRAKGADCTIAVIDVPLSEASRFGIMSTDGYGRIIRFAEKPKNPDSTNASMGIYIFGREVLRRYLAADEADPNSSNDFGKNVIPAMLADGAGLYAYPFDGYWRDVGTISSLWEANMDMLGSDPALNFSEGAWEVCSRQGGEVPQFIAGCAAVENSVIPEGCEIYGAVKNSVLGMGVRVMEGAQINDAVIMDNVVVGAGASVSYSIVDAAANIGERARIGIPRAAGSGIAVIGYGATVPPDSEVSPDEKLIFI